MAKIDYGENVGEFSCIENENIDVKFGWMNFDFGGITFVFFFWFVCAWRIPLKTIQHHGCAMERRRIMQKSNLTLNSKKIKGETKKTVLDSKANVDLDFRKKYHAQRNHRFFFCQFIKRFPCWSQEIFKVDLCNFFSNFHWKRKKGEKNAKNHNNYKI